MSLASELIGGYFALSRPSIGLANFGVELGPTSGYRRSGGPWAIDDTAATAVGGFGPFLEPVTFDEVLLLDQAGEVLRGIEVEPPVSLPAGSFWDHEVVVMLHG